MSTNNSLLPMEAIALVQHVELNKAGWWDKAVHRLVLASVWLADEPPDVSAVQTSLQSMFKISLPTAKVASALASMESKQMLLRLPNDSYRIPQEQLVTFEKEIAESEKAESKAKESFCKLVVEIGEGLEPNAVWAAFASNFLGPLIKQVGANAYRLVAGEKMVADRALVDHFLKPFPPKAHSKLRTLVATYLDPKRPEVRAYISRILHARFCVEASGLSEAILSKLSASVGKPIRFQLFVDTNFLFSLLELRDKPSNEPAQELRELMKRLGANLRVDLVVTPTTIDEAKSSIAYTKAQVSGLPVGQNFTQAVKQAGLSDMAMRFYHESLQSNGMITPEDWFGPYLTDFVRLARNKGVTLFNDKLDGYSTRQDVVDDINLVFKFEEKLKDNRRKSYPKVAHDMILWHFVNDKRPAYIESPIDANCWILTVDLRFIGFDEHKQKLSKSKVPLCIHPTSLIQLLQFWVPRTTEFEEAMLGSLRLPFLFQDFDFEGEKTSLKILKGIGRFEGSEGLSQDTITHVMLNNGLRSRLQTNNSEEAEIALIRDALVEEMKVRAVDETNKAKALEEEVRKRDSDIATLADQKRAVEEDNAQTKRAKVEADEAAQKALASQGAELGDVKTRLRVMEDAEAARIVIEAKRKVDAAHQRALLIYLALLVGVISSSIAAAVWLTCFLPQNPTLSGICATVIGAVLFILCHLGLEVTLGRREQMNALWPFRQVSRFRRWLWSLVVVGIVIGVVCNLVATLIQQEYDHPTPRLTSPVSSFPSKHP